MHLLQKARFGHSTLHLLHAVFTRDLEAHYKPLHPNRYVQTALTGCGLQLVVVVAAVREHLV